MKKPPVPALDRRKVFAGVGAVGALTTLVAVLPASPRPAPQSTPEAKPSQGGGYRLSEHVKQYYASART